MHQLNATLLNKIYLFKNNKYVKHSKKMSQ